MGLYAVCEEKLDSQDRALRLTFTMMAYPIRVRQTRSVIYVYFRVARFQETNLAYPTCGGTA